jgi:N6-L-threonylcarbamoyladenine synthase
MLIIGIETSCDETAAAIVDGDGRLLSDVVASQVEVHARYGGVVPEVASRQHILQARPVIEKAAREAGASWSDIGAVAVTHGPGLAGSLIVGVNTAKGLAMSLGRPLVGVNHLEGHIAAAWVRTESNPAAEELDDWLGRGPLACMVVSGGHTEIVVMRDKGSFELVGETRDDAAGEAFDKVARVLGLKYPGGPEIQRVADAVTGDVEPLPRAWMEGTFDFSFSGLKTAVINRARSEGLYPAPLDGLDPGRVARLARAFQDSVSDVLVTKCLAAAAQFGCAGIVLAGGVAANRSLRDTLTERSPIPVAIPPVALCTDNGAMIAMSGLWRFKAGRRDSWDLDVLPGLRIGAPA